MTEQEIVKYLKENENKGIILKFMPEEVKEWCKLHWNEIEIYDRFANWLNAKDCNYTFEESIFNVVSLKSSFILMNNPNKFIELKEYISQKLSRQLQFYSICKKEYDFEECIRLRTEINLLKELLDVANKLDERKK